MHLISTFPAILAISWIFSVSGTVCKYEDLQNAKGINQKYEGKYTLLDHVLCNKHYIYSQNGGRGNMFYIKHGNFTGWVAGPDKCHYSNNIDIIGYGDYTYPHQVPYWQERLHTIGDRWTNSSAITVTCTKWLSGWTVFGIVVVSLVVLGLIIALIAGCYSCCTQKPSSTRRTTQGDPVSHTNQAYPQVVAPPGSYPPFTPEPYTCSSAVGGTQAEVDKSQEAMGATAYAPPPAYTETFPQPAANPTAYTETFSQPSANPAAYTEASLQPAENPAADTQQTLSPYASVEEIPPIVGN